jgi:hypothetical protein
MKGAEKFEAQIADKADNKEGVVDALMKRYHVCEEVAEAMVWDSLCTVGGLQYLFNDLEKDSKLERSDLR